MEVTHAYGVPVGARNGRAPEPASVVRVHGRGPERQLIDLLIAAARARRSGALVLRGPTGTGKSALLEHAVAGASGMRLLRCRCDGAEADLPFAALHQLLEPVLPLVDELPKRLAAPLAAALGLEADRVVPDRHRVFTAVLALLTEVARRRPLLCAVDDGQWLDRCSADALGFTARRLGREGVALLVAVRDGEGRPFEPAGVAEVRLDGLDPQAAASLLAERAGPYLVPEVAQRLVQLTHGHPLALVDAAASLTQAQLAGRAPLLRPLPVSPGLRVTLVRQARRLPGPVQRLLLVIAAAGTEERIDVIVGAAAALDIALPALESAEAAGLVRIAEGAVWFRDPLVASAVYHDATFFERRAAHLALAQALGADDDRRARHLGAAILARDGRVAADLERAARRAGLRGDLSTRAEALQRAAELTPDGPERSRRLAAAASACWLAGWSVQALELLDRADRPRPGPLLAADMASLRGSIELRDYDLEGALSSLIGGVDRIAAISPARTLDLLVQAGEVVAAGADAGGAGALVRRADGLSADLADGADLLRGVERVVAGRVDEAAAVSERAISAAHRDGRAGHLAGLAAALSSGSDLPAAALASALNLLNAELGRLRSAGAVGALPGALASLAQLELAAGRHHSSFANASEGLARARDLGQRWVEGGCATTLAMLAAIRGHEEECAAFVELLLRPPGIQSAAGHAAAATWAAAVSDLGAGRFAEAQTRLEELAPGARLGHTWHALWSRPDAVEAAARTGRPEAARAALEVLEQAARAEWPAPAAALLARSRALVSTGREAERHFRVALAHHAEDERPFQHARTRLLWAEHLRRNRRRVDARDQLRSALEAFERLEARPWAARAHAELRATGETVRRAPVERERLTPQELRIAELVAQGGSNREVAEQLFLSPRTVGFHLAKIYQKLGVSTRTRLAHLLREDALETAQESRRRARPGLSRRARAEFRSHTPPPDGDESPEVERLPLRDRQQVLRPEGGRFDREGPFVVEAAGS